MDILIYNIVFWSVYMFICTTPQRMVQQVIDNS
jgi:branched-subunit amino acid permease